MKRVFIMLATGAAAIGLAACGGVSGQAASTQPTGTNALPSETPSASTAPSETETTTEEPTETPDDTTVTFGKTFTWENGVSGTITAPKAYKSSGNGIGGEKFKYAVIFTVTIVNKSGKPYDPSLASASVQSADVEGDQIFDSSNNLGGTPNTKVLNGRQSKFKMAFGVANPKDVVVEFSPGFEYNSAIWTK